MINQGPLIDNRILVPFLLSIFCVCETVIECSSDVNISNYIFITLFLVVVGVENDDTLKLHLKDMDLEFSWNIGRIQEVMPDLGNINASSPTSCSLEISKAIALLVEEQNIPEEKKGLASGVSAFLWMYTATHGSVFYLLMLKKAYIVSKTKLYKHCLT